MVWCECPQCKKPLGFAKEYTEAKRGLVRLKESDSCDYCKTHIGYQDVVNRNHAQRPSWSPGVVIWWIV